MRQGQHSRRPRSRGRRQPQNSANRVFDSNGPDVRVRGTAATVAEKYISLSRDAFSMGDRVKAENYLQHAEHYLRIQAEAKEAKEAKQQAQQPQQVDPSAQAQARDGEARDETQPGENRVKTRRARPARQQKPNGGEQQDVRPEKKPRKTADSNEAPVAEKTGSDDADGVAA